MRRSSTPKVLPLPPHLSTKHAPRWASSVKTARPGLLLESLQELEYDGALSQAGP